MTYATPIEWADFLNETDAYLNSDRPNTSFVFGWDRNTEQSKFIRLYFGQSNWARYDFEQGAIDFDTEIENLPSGRYQWTGGMHSWVDYHGEVDVEICGTITPTNRKTRRALARMQKEQSIDLFAHLDKISVFCLTEILAKLGYETPPHKIQQWTDSVRRQVLNWAHREFTSFDDPSIVRIPRPVDRSCLI